MPFSAPNKERVQDAYRKLATIASALNSSSDSLGKSAADLESSLKSLGLGVSSHVTIDQSEDAGYVDVVELWYTKLNGKWGLVLANKSGPPDETTTELWSFNEAPRHLRAKAVSCIPDLLDQLFKDAKAMADDIDAKASTLRDIAGAMREASSPVAMFKEKLEAASKRPGEETEGQLVGVLALDVPPNSTVAAVNTEAPRRKTK